jgi:hypothetical protein
MTELEARIRDANWRQGNLVQEDWTKLLLDRCLDNQPTALKWAKRLVVINQDCDIVADEDREPYIELLVGSTVRTSRPDFQKGKNPRWLQLPYSGGVLEFSIHNRFRVAKGDFVEVRRDIDNPLDDSSKDYLRRWLGRRYLRSAFPDAFNARLNTSKTLISFEKSELAKKVSVILFATVEEELMAESVYPLKALIGISDDTSEDERDQIERRLTQALAVDGINLIDLRLATEDDITYRNLRSYRRLDLDHRSLPDQEQVELPPAGIDAM